MQVATSCIHKLLVNHMVTRIANKSYGQTRVPFNDEIKNVFGLSCVVGDTSLHYDDVIMDAIASQITSLASVYSDV